MVILHVRWIVPATIDRRTLIVTTSVGVFGQELSKVKKMIKCNQVKTAISQKGLFSICICTLHTCAVNWTLYKQKTFVFWLFASH